MNVSDPAKLVIFSATTSWASSNDRSKALSSLAW
jgi:hypothetical protein